MTDEDDRMDRARRIREMREGAGDTQTQTQGQGQGQGQTQTDGSPDGSADDDPTPESDEPPAATDESDDSPEQVDDEGTNDDDGGLDADDEGGLTVPGAEAEDVEVDVEALAEQAGLASDDGKHDDEEGNGDGVAGPVGMAGAESAGGVEAAAETRVLEFDLGSERYCLDIDHVEEIVKRETVTRVPNTPDYVEGVVDLRGQITTILDPKELLDIDDEGSKELIVVFDPEEFEDQGAIGWVVDDVNQVTPVVDEEVNESPVDADHVNGVVERDGEFVVWTQPDVAIENAAG